MQGVRPLFQQNIVLLCLEHFLLQRLQQLQPCKLATAAFAVHSICRQYFSSTARQSADRQQHQQQQQQPNMVSLHHTEQQQQNGCQGSLLLQINSPSHQHSHARWYSTQAAPHRQTKRQKQPNSSNTSRSILQLPESIDWDQQQQQQQQEQGQLQRQRRQQASLAMQQQQQVPEGALMALIAAASSITDIERLVMQFHTQFKYFHIAAAVQKLPTLDMESSYNMRQRFQHLASLLASGASSVSRLFDAHQATGCLVALCSPRCLPPLRQGTLLRLLLVLLENEGGKLRELHSYELAQCAAAAAALQDAMRREQPPLQQQQHQHQQQLLEGSSGSDLPPAFDSANPPATISSSSSSSSSDAGALVLLDPLQRFWQVLHNVITPQLSTFSVDSLGLTALSFSAAGQSSRELMLGVLNAGLARPQKWAESPVAVCRMLKAMVLTETNHEGLLSVLAAAITGNTKAFSPAQLTDAAAAFAQLNFYHEPALLSICKAATRSIKHWPKSDVTSLLTSLEKLRFKDEQFMRVAVKILTAAAEQLGPPTAAAGREQLTVHQLAGSLAALLQLGFSGQQLEGLLAATVRQAILTADSSSSSSASLSPSAAIKLLWSTAVLEQPAASILPLLDDVTPQLLSQHDLRLLYQAHRLLTKGGSGVLGEQPAGVRDDVEQQQQQQWQRLEGLLQAGQEAAAVYAAASASRGKQFIQAVQDGFQDLGFEAPVRGLKVDGGALQPDLAFVASGSSNSSSNSGIGAGDSNGSVKVALMCDHAGKFSRNAPFELLGYWRVYGWLLEAEGWRVVRFPAHEWKVLLQDRGAHGGSAMSYVYNTLISQGINL